jgi:hypothetical protein
MQPTGMAQAKPVDDFVHCRTARRKVPTVQFKHLSGDGTFTLLACRASGRSSAKSEPFR